MINVRLAGTREKAVHLAVAGNVVDGVLSFFLRDVLDGIKDLIESVSEGFPTFSCSNCFFCKCFTQSRAPGCTTSCAASDGIE